MPARVRTPALAAAAVAVVAIVAAVAGPVRVGEPVLLLDLPAIESPPEEAPTSPAGEPEPDEQPTVVSVGVLVLVLVLVGTTLAAIVVLVAAAARALPAAVRARLRNRRTPPGDLELRISETLRDAAEEAARDLAAAPPGKSDDAVVACWVSLENAARRVGTPREPSATPTEFTAALLSEHSADPGAVRTLLSLYHRARFGEEELPDGSADRAREALRDIAAGLSEREQGRAP